jgi:Leucine-rich repeat (LRR) protein
VSHRHALPTVAVHVGQPADTSDEQAWEFLDHLTNCGSLQVLALDDNKLGGQLPGSIAQLLREIQALDIGKTRISGSIPPAIGDLIGLTTLGLESNLLNGTISAGIGNMKNLTKLALQGNRLTRPIPSSISDLTQLLELDLSSNVLSGFIPDTLANLTSPASPTLLS